MANEDRSEPSTSGQRLHLILEFILRPDGIYPALSSPTDDLQLEASRRPMSLDAGERIGSFRVDELVQHFRSNVPAGPSMARDLGVWTFQTLIERPGLLQTWRRLRSLQGPRSLLIELRLPRADGQMQVTEQVAEQLANLPIELLVDVDDPARPFVLRPYGCQMVRYFARMPGAEGAPLASGDRALLLMANPGHTLPDQPFAAFRSAVEQAITPTLELEEIHEATRAAVADLDGRYRLLIWLGHGSKAMPGLVLEAPDGSKKGAAWSREDVAAFCKRLGVSTVLLWSCHGAGRPWSSLARALLDPKGGNAGTVLAAQGLLAVDTVERLAGELLRQLVGPSRGSLDLALTEARRALEEHEWQWAMPVLYRRPRLNDQPVQDLELAAPRIEQSRRGGFSVNRLPDRPRAFVERPEELARIRDRVETSSLVLITGQPGVGKTELALELLREQRERETWDAVDIINLDGNSVPQLLEKLGLLAGLPTEAERTPTRLCHAIGDASVLICLDNAEGLLGGDEAGDLARLLEALLAHCTGLHLLLTSVVEWPSSSRLTIEPYLLTPLDPDQTIRLLDQRGNTIDRLSHQAREKLLETLAGNIRALQLMADLLERAAEPDAIASRVLEHPASLRVGPGANRDRNRALSVTIDLTVDLACREVSETRELLGLLALLPAGLPRTLLEQALPDLANAIQSLLYFHLHDPRRPRRVVLPAAIRDHLIDHRKLQPETPTLTPVAMAYSAHIDQLHVLRSKDAARWANAALLEEEPNLEPLIDQLRELEAHEPLTRLATSWGRALRFSHRLDEAERLLVTLPSTFALEGVGSRAQAQLLAARGDLFRRTDRLQQAESAYGDALTIFRQIDERIGEANTLKALGDLFMRTARLQQAESAYGDALPIFRQIEERIGEANTLLALGDLFMRTARLQQAESAYGDALTIFRQIEEQIGEADTIRAIAILESIQGAQDAGILRKLLASMSVSLMIEEMLGVGAALCELARHFGRTDRSTEVLVTSEASARALLSASDSWGFTLNIGSQLAPLSKHDPALLAVAARVAHVVGAETGAPEAQVWPRLKDQLPDDAVDSIEALGVDEFLAVRRSEMNEICKPWLESWGGSVEALDDPRAMLEILERFVQALEKDEAEGPEHAPGGNGG